MPYVMVAVLYLFNINTIACALLSSPHDHQTSYNLTNVLSTLLSNVNLWKKILFLRLISYAQTARVLIEACTDRTVDQTCSVVCLCVS